MVLVQQAHLEHQEEHGKGEVAQGIMPAYGGSAVHKWKQPGGAHACLPGSNAGRAGQAGDPEEALRIK